MSTIRVTVIEGLKLAGTTFLILSLLSANAVVNAENPDYSSVRSSSAQPAITAVPGIEYPSIANQDNLGRLQSALADYEYHASENNHGLQAPNRSHNLRTYFDASGIRVHDRTAADSPELMALSLIRLGRDSALVPVKPGTIKQRENRVEIHRSGLIEWYENSSQGLEQGFTLAERSMGEGVLILELAG